jgi:hypothetical protein
MPDVRSEIPPALRELYDLAGPILRYRLLRDVVRHDESYIATAELGLDLRKLSEVRDLFAAQDENGSWGSALFGMDTARGPLMTERAVLRLCEFGLERCEPVQRCVENVLLRGLSQPERAVHFAVQSEANARAAHRLVRDKCLRMIVRATREADALVMPQLELLLVEWQRYTDPESAARELPPTVDGFAAVCTFPWSEEDFPRVRDLLVGLVERIETDTGGLARVPRFYKPYVLTFPDKTDYVAQPSRLLHDLELAARFGVVRDLPVTIWLLDELEARQDADGFFRFDDAEPSAPSWYFPLEETDPQRFFIEYTFRAQLIFKLMEYDL